MTSTLADLQRRNLEQMEAKDAAPNEDNTDSRKSVSTEARTDVSKDALTDGLTPVGTEASASASKSVSTPARASRRKEGLEPARQSARQHVRDEPVLTEEGFLAYVALALESRQPLVGGVKATVDMSPELSARAKRYLADHRGQSTRQILIELFDAFLTIQGY